MVEQGLIKDEKTIFALKLLKKCMFERKNFDDKITQNDAEAKRLLRSMPNDLFTDEDKDYIKKNYLGRQQFMAFYSDFGLARFLSELLRAKKGTLLEPSCGSGRLLEYLNQKDLKITCYEIDPQSARVCSILYPKATVICEDALENLENIEGKFDYCLCSPPWGLYVGTLDKYSMTAKLGGEDSTFYFTELMIRSLKDGGKGVVLLPTSIFQMEQYDSLCNLMGEWGQVLYRIDLPKECCSSSNIIIDCTVLLFKRIFGYKKNTNEFPYTRMSSEDWNDYLAGDSKGLANHILEGIV